LEEKDIQLGLTLGGEDSSAPRRQHHLDGDLVQSVPGGDRDVTDAAIEVESFDIARRDGPGHGFGAGRLYSHRAYEDDRQNEHELLHRQAPLCRHCGSPH
jgi:hypothetical protein